MALLERDLAGLDQLDLPVPTKPSFRARLWSSAWPKLLAIAITLLVWQIVVWSGWRREDLLPPPGPVFSNLFHNFADYADAAWTTLQRGVEGFLLSIVIGATIGAGVSRSRILRAAIGSMITGLQTMPSVAWFPLAILLFQLGEGAVFFVVVMGAAPAIANGLITGIDHIQPVLLRAGRVLGAKRWSALRYVILPAALPSFVGGLKQGWAFAWRSLLAAELIATVPGHIALGQQLHNQQELFDSTGLLAVMIVILVVGVAVDAAVFGTLERAVRRRYGLIDEAGA
jgi:NitT/TauT family transport system permease protein